MSTLYEIKGEIFELMEMMEEDPDNQCIADTLEALKGELEIKAEGYCKAIREFEAKGNSIDEEIKRLKARKQAAENNADRLKKALLVAMTETGNEKIQGELFTLSIRNNAVSLDTIPDIGHIPEKYLVPKDPDIDKKLLLADIKAGIAVDGVTTKRSKSLMIK